MTNKPQAAAVTMTNELALMHIEHAISYLLQSADSHVDINDACNILYAAHKTIGPTGEINDILQCTHGDGWEVLPAGMRHKQTCVICQVPRKG